MPTLWQAGVQGSWDYLAIDLLGSSLDSLYKKSGRNLMDLRSVLCIAQQVVSSQSDWQFNLADSDSVFRLRGSSSCIVEGYSIVISNLGIVSLACHQTTK